MKHFVIAKVGWHTKVKGNPETLEHIVARFFAVATFLQGHDLTTRTLVADRSEIDDDFQISTEDLTEEGLALMRKAYDTWLGRVDRGADPENVTYLEESLQKLRN